HRVDGADLDGPGRGPEVTGEDAKRGRLSGPVQAEKAHRLSVFDLEGDRTEWALGTEVFGNVLCSYHKPSKLLGFLASSACPGGCRECASLTNRRTPVKTSRPKLIT